MTRKVNKVGQNTLTVSLPQSWVKKYGIKQGDELGVDEDSKRLIISTSGQRVFERVKIDLFKGNFWYTNQHIRNLYTYGFDEIEVSFDDPVVLKDIQAAVDRLIGYEIVEQRKNSCLVKAISYESTERFDAMIKRVFYQIFELFDMMSEAMRSGEYEEQFLQAHTNIYRFMSFCRRILSKNEIYSERRNKALSIVLMRVFMVSTNLVYLHKYLCKDKPKIKKEAIDYLKKASEHLRVLFHIYSTHEIIELQKTNENRMKFIGEMEQYLETHKGPECVVYHYAAEIVRLISTSGGALLTFCVKE